MRGNEGEAALYGIEYDDSKYDYMQHLKSIGTDPDAVFIARKDLKSRGRKDADLMLKADYAANNNVSIPTELLPSTETVKRTYQDQQGIPDAIAGLQPDMDPRLREVLE
jgi:protein LTV1